MRAAAVIAFLAGLLLWVRVMFFGVQRRLDEDHLSHRAWPLALAAFLVVVGVMTYVRSRNPAGGVTVGWVAMVVLLGAAAGAGAAWVVRRSAAAPSTDPEDDPRYRFQGHIARVIEPIDASAVDGEGRIDFSFDGRQHVLRAVWSPEGDLTRHTTAAGSVGSEVVIERVDGDVAYVEPWTVVEERL